MQLKLLFGKVVTFLFFRLSGVVLSFFMFSALARVMSQENFGIFSMIFSSLLLLTAVLSLGRREVVERFIPRVLAMDQPHQAQDLASEGWRTIGRSTAAFLVFGLCVCGVLWFSNVGLSHDQLKAILGASILLTATIAAEFQLHILRGHGKLGMAILPRDVIWRLMSFILVLPFLFMEIELSAPQAVILLGLCLTVVVIGQALANPEIAFLNALKAPPLGPDIARAARLLYVPHVLNTGFPNAVPIIVGLFIAPVESGILFIVQRVAMLLQMPHMASRAIAINMISGQYAKGNIAGIQTQISRLTSLISIASLIGLLIVVLLGNYILSIFGHSYSSNNDILVIVCIGKVLATIFGPVGVVAEVAGHEKFYSRSLIVANSLSIIMLAILTFLFGVYGAAWAFSVHALLYNMPIWIFIRKKRLPDTSIVGFLFPVRNLAQGG